MKSKTSHQSNENLAPPDFMWVCDMISRVPTINPPAQARPNVASRQPPLWGGLPRNVGGLGDGAAIPEKPVTSTIPVIFNGSVAVGSISSKEVRVTHADRSVTIGTILTQKGVNEIILAGLRATGRGEIIATMSMEKHTGFMMIRSLLSGRV